MVCNGPPYGKYGWFGGTWYPYFGKPPYLSKHSYEHVRPPSWGAHAPLPRKWSHLKSLLCCEQIASFPGQNLYVSVFFVASSAFCLAKVMTSLDFTPVLSFFVSKTRPGRQSPTCGEHRAVTGIWRFTTGGHFALKAWRGILEPMAPWFYLVYLDPWLPGNGKSHISCRWMWFMLVNVENSSTSWPRLRLSQRFFGVKSLNGTIRVCGDPRSSSNGQLYHSDLNNNYGTMKYIGLW